MNYKLLIVDDEPTIRNLLVDFCEVLGDCCVCTENFTEALAQLAIGSYDLLLLDMNLKYEKAYDFLPLIRAAAPDIPIIVMSGEQISAMQSLVAIGATDYLKKPFSFTEFNDIRLHYMENK